MTTEEVNLENELTITRFNQMCERYPDKAAVIFSGAMFFVFEITGS